MSQHRHTRGASAVSAQTANGGGMHGWLLSALVALCVSRPLLPSEAVSWLGDGQTLNMLWLCLALLTALAAVGNGGLRFRWTATDVAVAALWACYVASALWAGRHASPRPALNMLWEWTSLALVYFLTRELVRTAAQRRAIVAVMIALAVALAAYSYYQYFVSMPADRLEYAENADAMLRRNGQWYAPGSVERRQFENRLESKEPMATFALTNSLAGFLAPWLIVAIGLLGANLARRSRSAGARVALAIAVLAVGGALVLTKSRSAYVGMAVGLAPLPWALPAIRRLFGWRLGLALAAVAGVLVAAALAVRGLDAAVLDEAGKSLGYRLEYWRSSWAMICDHPVFGCGPGNFQDCYTRYKLPQASEEIVDPHNLFFEIWATAGTPALLALVAVLGCFAWQTGRRRELADTEAEGGTLDEQPPSGAKPPSAWIVAGAAAGMLLANWIGPLAGLEFESWKALAGALLGGGILLGLWSWVGHGRLPALLLPLGVVVLVVHLSAAGGISFPGVAYGLWIMLALGVNQTPGAQVPDVPPTGRLPWGSVAGVVLAGAGAGACYLTAFLPVIRSSADMFRVQAEAARGDQRHYERWLLEAAAADPLSGQVWTMLAEVEFRRLENHRADDEQRRQFIAAVDTMLRLRPNSSNAYRQAGEWMLALFEQSGDPRDQEKASVYCRRAVELYPNSASAHAELALALDALGQPADARQEVHRALELDAAMPHADKKLPADLGSRWQRLKQDE